MKQIIIWFLLVTTHQTFGQGNVGIGTNNPQATLHVAGTLRIDSLPQNNSPQVLTITPAGIIGKMKLDSVLFPDPETSLLELEYGEDISAGDIIAIGDGVRGYLTLDQTVNNQNLLYSAGTYVGQVFKTSEVATGIRAITCRMTSNETLFRIAIREISTGVPTGNDLGSVTYYYSQALSGIFTLVFPIPIPVQPNTLYAFYCDPVRNNGGGTSYFFSTTSTYPDGTRIQSTDGGITWQMFPDQDLVFRVYETQTQSGKAYRAVAQSGVMNPWATSFLLSGSTTFGSSDRTNNVIGFAVTSGIKGSIGTVAISSIYESPTPVFTPGATYWLSSTPGMVSPVVVPPEKKLGFAISETKLLWAR
jgi:hypothetical protein